MEFKRAGFLTKIVVLALLIYMATALLDLRGKIQEVQVQRDELAQQVTDQQLENRRLADAIANSDDKYAYLGAGAGSPGPGLCGTAGDPVHRRCKLTARHVCEVPRFTREDFSGQWS